MPNVLKQQNLKVSYQYIDWVLNNNRGIMGHFYAFTSATGLTDYFTDLDLTVNTGYVNGAIWKANSLRFEGLHRKVAVGLNVDEQTLKIWASPTDTIFGGNFLTTVEDGVLDGATVIRYRGIWPFVTGNAAVDLQQQPLAFITLYTGLISNIVKGGASHVEMKVKSGLNKLTVNMPRNYYQAGCNWTLFSPGCTLNQATYAATGTIGSAPTIKTIPISGGIVTPTGGDALPNYAQGRLTFTSGALNGLTVLIDSNDSVNLYLAYPLDEAPSAGDTVTFYPGCSKAYSTCNAKYNNTQNFRGFDKVPPVMVSL
jgi:uncharacterized phage protein (TIGR02218 family)